MKKIIFIAVSVFLLSTSVFAGEAKVSELVSKDKKVADQDAVLMVKGFFDKSGEVKSNFRQTLFDASGKVTQQSEGVLSMRRPNQFRWDYKNPYEQMILADGAKLWVFDIDLDQVTVREQKEAVDSTPASILTEGYSAVEKSFIVSAADQTQSIKWVLLTPKDQSSEYGRIMIGFKDGVLEALQIRDKFDQMTVLEFSNMQLDASLQDSTFTFTPPDGVDVIGK